MVLNVQIISEGCDDRGRHGSCGIAFIRINGKDYARKGRGYNIVVINSNTGMKQLLSIISCRFFMVEQQFSVVGQYSSTRSTKQQDLSRGFFLKALEYVW